MKTLPILTAVATSVAALISANAQISMAPLGSFGGGDGWLAPGEGGYAYLGTSNNERGMAYGNGVLYLVSRSGGNNIRRLDPLTGTDLGSPLDVTGISGGTFAVNKVAVGGDGVIYVNNLSVNTGTDPFKIYRWATEASAPTVAFSGSTSVVGARLGDSSLAVTGSGSSTRLATGFAASPSVAGNNGYSIIDPTAGTSTEVGFVGTPPNAGDFRLGLTYTDSAHVFGNQGNTALRYTSYSGGSGTLLGTATGIFSIAERAMSYSVINGLPVLATISTGDSTVRLYDASDPLALVQIASGNNTVAPVANGNATGDVAWGNSFYNGDGTSSAYLYTLSSNQGIQAYLVTVPEPSSMGLAVAGFGLLALRLARRGHRD